MKLTIILVTALLAIHLFTTLAQALNNLTLLTDRFDLVNSILKIKHFEFAYE